MRYFDLHCDTATCLYDGGEDFGNTDRCVNASDAAAFEKYYQVFAFWFDDETKIRGFDYLKNALEYFNGIKDKISAVPVFSVEGGHAIEGNLDNIYFLKENEFKLFGLSWNGENELASGNASNPKKGLTPLGKEAVKLLEKLEIVPDISHLSDAGVYDVFDIAQGKIVATHSCCRSVFDSMRNITDEMITEIINRKGLIGLNLYPAALSDSPKAEDLLFHAEKILSLGGEDVLAFGCDWDGTSLPRGVTGLRSLENIFGMFSDKFSERTAEKIFFDNAYGCFAEKL